MTSSTMSRRERLALDTLEAEGFEVAHADTGGGFTAVLIDLDTIEVMVSDRSLFEDADGYAVTSYVKADGLWADNAPTMCDHVDAVVDAVRSIAKEGE